VTQSTVIDPLIALYAIRVIAAWADPQRSNPQIVAKVSVAIFI